MEFLFSMAGFFIYLIIFSAFIRAALKRTRNVNTRVVSSDGHTIPKKDDITCEGRDGHHHVQSKEFGSRYIVHNEPNTGYVILNGEMRKIEDCKNL